jgi:hypothetical protein
MSLLGLDVAASALTKSTDTPTHTHILIHTHTLTPSRRAILRGNKKIDLLNGIVGHQ